MIKKFKIIIILIVLSQNILASINPVEPEFKLTNKTCFDSMLETLFQSKHRIMVVDFFKTNIHNCLLKNMVKEVYTSKGLDKSYIGTLQVIVFVNYLNETIVKTLATKLTSIKHGKILVISLSQQDEKSLDYPKAFSSFRRTTTKKLALAHWTTKSKLVVFSSFDIADKHICSQKVTYKVYRNFCDNQMFKENSLAITSIEQKLCQLRVLQIPGETLAVHKDGNNIGLVSRMVEAYAELRRIRLDIGKY